MAAARDVGRWTLVPLVAAAVMVPTGTAAQPAPVVAASAVESGSGSGTGNSMAASAPCSRRADVTVRVTSRDDASDQDRVRVTVRDAGPGSRWRLTVEQHQGDQGQVVLYPTQRANDRGRWVLVDTAFRGYLTVDVRARSRAGQICEVFLAGRVSGL